MKETAKVLMAVDKKFLEKVDQHWKKLNFKTRTEYMLFLVRNDVNDSNKAV
jgi:hypothetical protein